MTFPCTSCGACCRRVGQLAPALRLLVGFPYQATPDGACEHLDADARCRIYATRPQVCRTDGMHTVLGLDRATYYAQTAAVCNDWQVADGLDPRYRVVVDWPASPKEGPHAESPEDDRDEWPEGHEDREEHEVRHEGHQGDQAVEDGRLLNGKDEVDSGRD